MFLEIMWLHVPPRYLYPLVGCYVNNVLLLLGPFYHSKKILQMEWHIIFFLLLPVA